MSWLWWGLGWAALCAVFVAGWAWALNHTRGAEWERADRDEEAAHWAAVRKAKEKKST
jgi:hypothetical protein